MAHPALDCLPRLSQPRLDQPLPAGPRNAMPFRRIGCGEIDSPAERDATMAMDHETIRRTAGLMDQAGDSTRLGVLVALAGGEVVAGDLVAGLPGMTQPALSHHLKLMRLGGLVDYRRTGKQNRYGLTATGRAVLAAAEGLAGGGG